MTPLEIIKLAHKVRQAQKRWPEHPKHGVIEVMALEKQLDEALEPYMDYVKAIEAQP